MKKIIKPWLMLVTKIWIVVVNKSKVAKQNQLLTHSIYNSDIGNYNYIGKGVIMNNVKIKNYCSIAAYTQIGGMEHDYNDLSTSTYLNDKGKHDLVTIEDDVWIGAGVYVKSGIRIGRGAVIGAGSIVTKDVEDFSVCLGVPAKHLKSRFNLEKQLKHKQINFNLNPKEIKYESSDS